MRLSFLSGSKVALTLPMSNFIRIFRRGWAGSGLYHSVAHYSGGLYSCQETTAVSDKTPTKVTLNLQSAR